MQVLSAAGGQFPAPERLDGAPRSLGTLPPLLTLYYLPVGSFQGLYEHLARMSSDMQLGFVRMCSSEALEIGMSDTLYRLMQAGRDVESHIRTYVQLHTLYDNLIAVSNARRS